MKKPLFYSLNNFDESNCPFPEMKSAFIIKNKSNWFLMYQMNKNYFLENNSYNCNNILQLSSEKAAELLAKNSIKSVFSYGK